MTRSFLEANRAGLKAIDAPVFHWLAASGDRCAKTDESMITNRWGLADWRLPSGKGLFQAVPPSVCYRDWAPKEQAATSATIIVGTNLGYGLNHVLSHTPNPHRVFVLEPRPEMMTVCLTQTDSHSWKVAK